MTLQVLNWTSPEVGSKLKTEAKLLKADFGDGYTSIAGDGINFRRKVLEVTFPYMTLSEARALWNFFDVTCGAGAKPFLYTETRTAQQLKWTCEQYEWQDKEAGYVSITATFKQSFNLDT